MRIIGVTGGIGTGKSTVSKILQDLGAVIIDADIVAREIVKKGENALSEITACFGTSILNDEGELDRKKLGNIVFADPQKLSVLNEITHKYIIDRIRTEVQKAENNNIETLIIDAAIPFEKGFLDTVGEVWVVTAEEKIRIERIMKRNGFTYEEALKRILSQMKQEEYIKLADHVISNNSGMEELSRRIEDLFFIEQGG